ncbi:hypothetical protein ACJMK2_027914 [Sinanodonta woodiana]|uniref:Uncharacterized protein n=1 Tax=Sinanodonta woodiana TaxID=1069815 RepID=A0ABD3X6V3_SINWO
MTGILVLISIFTFIGLCRGETCRDVQQCNHEVCKGSHIACHNQMCTCDPDTNSPHNGCITMQDCDRVGLCLIPGTTLTCIDNQCNCIS